MPTDRPAAGWSWLPLVVGVVSAAATAAVAGPLAALAAGSAIAFVVLRLQARGRKRRLSAAVVKSEPQQSAAEVPAALDVLAACLTAGSTVEHALAGVADAFGGPTGCTLAAVAALSSWGAPVETAWAGCLEQPAWAAVARAVIRASHSGAALTDVLTHQAIDSRRALRTAAAAAAQRAGVRAVLPLGLCFLPAFVLAGVVPVVAGFARTLLR
jgi:pilus assembly protein TadC